MSEKSTEVNCGNCVGACCRAGTWMELTLEEVARMLRAGTKVQTLHQPVDAAGTVIIQRVIDTAIVDGQPMELVEDRPVSLTAGHGLYRLLVDCAFLEVGEVGVTCTAYDDRPGLCRDFESGGEGCLEIRRATVAHGRFPDWQPVEFIGQV
jgi:Fe-S-cluster containining protein